MRVSIYSYNSDVRIGIKVCVYSCGSYVNDYWSM